MRKMLCYGDSNTFGYNPRSYWGEPYPDDVRWTGILHAKGWDVLNCGQNGREIPSTEGGLQAAERLIYSAMPVDIVTVMLGTNDFLNHPHFTAGDVAARMERLLQALRSRSHRMEILLIAPPPLRDGVWTPDARIIRESAYLADEYCALADRMGVGFADAGEWDITLDFDGVHFSPEGHAAFAKYLLKTLEVFTLASCPGR